LFFPVSMVCGRWLEVTDQTLGIRVGKLPMGIFCSQRAQVEQAVEHLARTTHDSGLVFNYVVPVTRREEQSPTSTTHSASARPPRRKTSVRRT